jgi:hypothetical protein
MDIAPQVIVLALLGASLSFALRLAMRRKWLFRDPLPVKVVLHCGDRFETGNPMQTWVNFLNSGDKSYALTVTIEFLGGKNVFEHITVDPGEYSYRIPEPQRVKAIKVSASGYAGVLVYL